MYRGAVAEIDLDAVASNLNLARKFSYNRPVIAVVKADAYGHGAIEVSKRLVVEGVSFFAVAYSEEGLKLRGAGIKARILVLFDKDSIPEFFDHDLIPVIHDVGTAVRLSEEAKKRGRHLPVHIKIDTGMGRLGLSNDEVLDDIVAISKLEYLRIEGLMSHFSEADAVEQSYAAEQLGKFIRLRDKLRPSLKNDVLCHMANSAAIFFFKDAYLDAVRPGLMLYGCPPFSDNPLSSPFAKGGKRGATEERDQRGSGLRPAMSVKTRILSLRRLQKGTPVSYGRTFITKRESLIAVLPVGYADGYGRVLSNNADVLVRGRRVPVVGRVCMDLTMADVTGVEDIVEGDEVVLIGKQGDEEITVHEIAERAGTISYEILTAIGNRSKRIYI